MQYSVKNLILTLSLILGLASSVSAEEIMMRCPGTDSVFKLTKNLLEHKIEWRYEGRWVNFCDAGEQELYEDGGKCDSTSTLPNNPFSNIRILDFLLREETFALKGYPLGKPSQCFLIKR